MARSTTEPFSLRAHLYNQGVRKPEVFSHHMEFIQKTLAVNPRMDISRYKVSDPNHISSPVMG